MIVDLIQQIKTTLSGVNGVKEVFAHRTSKFSKFPAVMFLQDGYDNSFETQSENMKIFRFIIFVVIGTGQISEQKAYEEVLPKVVDEITSKFDSNWDFGDNEGHRIRAIIDTATQAESVTLGEGKAIVQALNLKIKVLTNN